MSELDEIAARMRSALKDWENAKAWCSAAEKALRDAKAAEWNACTRFNDLRRELERQSLVEGVS